MIFSARQESAQNCQRRMRMCAFHHVLSLKAPCITHSTELKAVSGPLSYSTNKNTISDKLARGCALFSAQGRGKQLKKQRSSRSDSVFVHQDQVEDVIKRYGSQYGGAIYQKCKVAPIY